MTNPKSIAVLAVAMAALVAVMSFSIAVDGAEEPEYDQDLGTKYSYEIQFSFTGKDALSVTWDFGDGSEPVTAFYPQHTFPDKGTYYVTQDAYNTYDPDGDGEGSHSIAVYKITIAGYPWIEFNSNGGSDVATIQQDDFGVAADKPADPTRTGYTFAGWYTDEDLTEAYDWETAVKQPITLYASWIQQVTVSFDLDGGNGSIPDQTLDVGDKAIEPQEPTKNGYRFLGWYNGDVRWSFNDPVTESMTLTAKWYEIPAGVTMFRITFDADGGISDFSSISCEKGKSIILPGASKDGYRFNGWYDGETFVGTESDEYTPDSDVTLTAHWTESDDSVGPGPDEPEEPGEDGTWYWIATLVVAVILGVIAFLTRSWIVAILAVVSVVAAAALYIWM